MVAAVVGSFADMPDDERGEPRAADGVIALSEGGKGQDDVRRNEKNRCRIRRIISQSKSVVTASAGAAR